MWIIFSRFCIILVLFLALRSTSIKAWRIYVAKELHWIGWSNINGSELQVEIFKLLGTFIWSCRILSLCYGSTCGMVLGTLQEHK